jgi:putative ABC transport system permease protein
VLLAGAGVMMRSFLNVYNQNLGIDSARALTGFFNLPVARYPRADVQLAFYDHLRARLAAIPGMESVAIANARPRLGSARVPYELAGAPPVDAARRPAVPRLVISPAYFRTLGATVLAGREFTDSDGGAEAPVVIVNQRFARTYWPGEDPLGKRLRLFDGRTSGTWLTVVGVVSNIAQRDAIQATFDPAVYVPYRSEPAPAMWVFARARVPPATLGAAFRQEVQALDADLPWLGPYTLSDNLSGVYWKRGVDGVLFLVFAVLALLLASVGLYTVVAHAVTRRTQEIGIRIAIGATAHDILAMVFSQGMRPLGIGLTIGLVASVAVNRVLSAELVQVSPADPTTLVLASVLLVLSAALGCWIPARCAMRVDPVVALRHE